MLAIWDIYTQGKWLFWRA